MDKIIIYNLDNFGLLTKGYETYLRDFVNHSSYFTNNYGPFSAPLSESHGEDDANSKSKYSLDFKRFISQDECKYRHYNKMPERYIIKKSDAFNKTRGHFDIYRCMMNLTASDMEKIRLHKYEFKNKFYEKEVSNVVNKLSIKHKNIMLYMQKIIEHNNIKDIIDFLNETLKEMLKFRSNHSDKDLYFSFITTKNKEKTEAYKCVFLKVENCKFTFVDCVPTSCSQCFQQKRQLSTKKC